MEVPVSEVARMRGVSPERVRALARSGQLRARRVGGHWLVDPADAARRARVSRPMSQRMAWAMCVVLSGHKPAGLDPSELSRLRARIGQLRSSDDPAPQVASWLSSRAPRLELSVHPGGVERLRDDARILPSGVSDPRAQLSAAQEVEGYVEPGELSELRRDYLLVQAERPNVVLHVADVAQAMGGGIGEEGPAPLGLVIADLADYGRPRENAQVRRLVAELPW